MENIYYTALSEQKTEERFSLRKLIFVGHRNSRDANSQRQERRHEGEPLQSFGSSRMAPQLGDEVESDRDADDGGHDGDAEENEEPVVDDAVALVAMLESLSTRHRRMPGTGASLHFFLGKSRSVGK